MDLFGRFRPIEFETAYDFIMPRHYAGRIPSISYAYGWVEDGTLQAVCTFGKPASRTLCDGVCGKEYSPKVFELNRLCRRESFKGQLSEFVSACLRDLKQFNLIVVSYADKAMNHHGYIYQACNFIYTGATLRRTDKYAQDGKHHRHGYDDPNYRKVRSSKHRYIYFAGDKRFARKAKRAMNYKEQVFPKGENKNYKLGQYIETELVNI